MAKMITSAITILRCQGKYLFLKRRKPPYENLWALVGGKVEVGEHIPTAAIREVMEETGASHVDDYKLKGVVSERLVTSEGNLVNQFIIFVSEASIDSFQTEQDEGTLSLFSIEDLENAQGKTLPSDYEMFFRFRNTNNEYLEYHEAELIEDNGEYKLNYYRDGMN